MVKEKDILFPFVNKRGFPLEGGTVTKVVNNAYTVDKLLFEDGHTIKDASFYRASLMMIYRGKGDGDHMLMDIWVPNKAALKKLEVTKVVADELESCVPPQLITDCQIEGFKLPKVLASY